MDSALALLSQDPMDEVLLQYIHEILETRDSEEISESVPPLLLKSGRVSHSEEGEILCARLLELLNVSPTSSSWHELQQPITMPLLSLSEDIPSLWNRKPQYSGGNSYEVENNTPEVLERLKQEEIKETTLFFQDFLDLTYSEDPEVRRKALRELCPCQVRHNVEEFWSRIMAMIQDPDPHVRYQVLHNLCDGSPRVMEDYVIKAVESMHDDSDKLIRRRVRQVLACYRRTGQWNIM